MCSIQMFLLTLMQFLCFDELVRPFEISVMDIIFYSVLILLKTFTWLKTF